MHTLPPHLRGSPDYPLLFLIRVLLLQELDEGFGSLEEVLLALRLCTLRSPVYDRLVRDAVGVVEHLEVSVI